MSGDAPHMPPAYRLVLAVGGPLMTRWGRLTVSGLDCLPADGPVIVAADHDSYWDPIAIAAAARGVRAIRALAKSTLWKAPPVGALMTGMGHIPVTRGVSNDEAMAVAVAELRAGACIGMFPEGHPITRPRSCARAAASADWREQVPEAVVVCARTVGTTDIVRVPTRPDVSVDFFRPRGGRHRIG